MRLLLIEDNKESVKRIIDFAEEKNWVNECQGFDSWEDAVRLFQPDIIVLDWMDDADDPRRGKEILETIWEKQFRPIIVFSAVAGTIQIGNEIKNNPLITIIPKGDEEVVVDKLTEWSNYVPVISELKEDMNKALIGALNTIEMFKALEYPGDEVVKYMITTRAATFFSRDICIENPPAWIQYIYPPMSEHILVCDIIRVVSREADLTRPGLPDEYRVILSPSCDMVNHGEIQILIAKCEPKESFSEYRLSVSETTEVGKGKDKVDKVAKLLNQGYCGAKVALPEIPGILPYMTINLKNLNQITRDTIADNYGAIEEQHSFFRVASIDSPFREQIVWAHMLNSCRPGLPNRDITTWAKGVLSSDRS